MANKTTAQQIDFAHEVMDAKDVQDYLLEKYGYEYSMQRIWLWLKRSYVEKNWEGRMQGVFAKGNSHYVPRSSLENWKPPLRGNPRRIKGNR